MKLSEYAKQKGVTYLTALRWFKKGIIKGAYQMPTGTILVEDQVTSPEHKITKVSIYCRVSSYTKKDDLSRQVERCVEFATKNGYQVDKVIREVASGMNDRRPKLLDLIKSKPEAIIVEHKDRLTRFGFTYFEEILPLIGTKIIVINRDTNDEDDLMKDLISIITSFCCRLYGIRKGRNIATKIKKDLNDSSNCS